MWEHPFLRPAGVDILERLVPPARSPKLEQDVVAYAAHQCAQALGPVDFPPTANRPANASESLLLNVARLDPRRRVSPQFPVQDGAEILDKVTLYGWIMRFQATDVCSIEFAKRDEVCDSHFLLSLLARWASSTHAGVSEP